MKSERKRENSPVSKLEKSPGTHEDPARPKIKKTAKNYIVPVVTKTIYVKLHMIIKYAIYIMYNCILEIYKVICNYI